MNRLIGKWTKEREETLQRRKEMEIDTVEMKRGFNSLKCYVRKLEEKLSCADDDLVAEMENSKAKEREIEILLTKISLMETELRSKDNQCKVDNMPMMFGDRFRDQFQEESEELDAKLGEKEEEMTWILRTPIDQIDDLDQRLSAMRSQIRGMEQSLANRGDQIRDWESESNSQLPVKGESEETTNRGSRKKSTNTGLKRFTIF